MALILGALLSSAAMVLAGKPFVVLAEGFLAVHVPVAAGRRFGDRKRRCLAAAGPAGSPPRDDVLAPMARKRSAMGSDWSRVGQVRRQSAGADAVASLPRAGVCPQAVRFRSEDRRRHDPRSRLFPRRCSGSEERRHRSRSVRPRTRPHDDGRQGQVHASRPASMSIIILWRKRPTATAASPYIVHASELPRQPAHGHCHGRQRWVAESRRRRPDHAGAAAGATSDKENEPSRRSGTN